MDATTYLLSGGGTGGHLYPGLAVAEAIVAIQPDAKVVFMTTQRPLDRDLLSRTPFEQIPQPVQPLSTRPWRWPAFWNAWRKSVALADAVICERWPSAVLGLGGYAAAPPVVAASRRGIPTLILNPDAIPGKANRHLSRYVQTIVLQWHASLAYLKQKKKCAVLGCPMRAAIAQADADRGRRALSLDADRPTLLVTAGSLGARTVNDALLVAWPKFHAAHPEWQLVHLTGQADETRVRDGYAASNAPAVVRAYSHELPDLLAAADLVIARAGASTLAELTAMGKPSVLFPYPFHRDRHQHANAQVLVDAGAAVMIDDTKDGGANAAALGPVLERLSSPQARTALSEGARTLARPDAAQLVAQRMVGDVDGFDSRFYAPGKIAS